MIYLNQTEDKKLKKYIEEYEKYLKYLPQNFIQEVYRDFIKIYSYECGINPDVYFDLYLQNQVNKELCEQIKQGNIDLEIELIDKYMHILDYIIRKSEYCDTIDREEVIITAIETYDGKKMFSSHIFNVFKNSQKNRTHIEKPKSFKETIDEYVSKNKINSVITTYLDMLFIKFNVIEYIDDDILKKYAYLKYGYYNNIYFSNDDIVKILNIDKSSIYLMYKKCLDLLKQLLNENIDLIVKLYFNDKQLKISYIKSNYYK